MMIRDLKKYIKENKIPDDAEIFYHAYYKGCRLEPYVLNDAWIYKNEGKILGLVINPQEDYDGRRAHKI